MQAVVVPAPKDQFAVVSPPLHTPHPPRPPSTAAVRDSWNTFRAVLTALKGWHVHSVRLASHCQVCSPVAFLAGSSAPALSSGGPSGRGLVDVLGLEWQDSPMANEKELQTNKNKQKRKLCSEYSQQLYVRMYLSLEKHTSSFSRLPPGKGSKTGGWLNGLNYCSSFL